MNQKTIILENGHGSQTPGKRSPIWGDGSQLLEWEFNRDIVRRIVQHTRERRRRHRMGMLYKRRQNESR